MLATDPEELLLGNVHPRRGDARVGERADGALGSVVEPTVANAA